MLARVARGLVRGAADVESRVVGRCEAGGVVVDRACDIDGAVLMTVRTTTACWRSRRRAIALCHSAIVHGNVELHRFNARRTSTALRMSVIRYIVRCKIEPKLSQDIRASLRCV